MLDLDLENYKNYCVSCNINYKLDSSIENYIDWLNNNLYDLVENDWK